MTRLLFLSGLAGISMILGGLLPLRRKRWSQQVLLRFMAFGSGVLLGAAFLHVIPAAMALSGARAGLGLAGAFVAIFAVEQVGLAHACPECAAEQACRVHPMGWIAFSALGVHSLLDGVSIAAGFAASEGLGMMAALAVLVHKVPTGISLAAILLGSGFSNWYSFLLTLAVAVATPIGTLASWGLLTRVPSPTLALILGLSAGSFVYIGASDILPRLHGERSLPVFVLLALGMVLTWAARV
jgi:zinc and cadmium transporter